MSASNFDRWANQVLGNGASNVANRAPPNTNPTTRSPGTQNPDGTYSNGGSTQRPTPDASQSMDITLPPLVDKDNEGASCADRCYQVKMAREVECTMKRKRVERWLNDQGCKSVVMPADNCGNIIFDDKMYPSHQQRLMGNSQYYRQPIAANGCGCGNGCGMMKSNGCGC